MKTPLYRVEGLVKRYPDRVALDQVSLVLEPGHILGLLGINGAGKSSLLAILAGQLPWDAGELWFDGQVIHAHPPALRQRMGYLPEILPLYPRLTLTEQLRWSGRLFGLRGVALDQAVELALLESQLTAEARCFISRLSKGQRQRLATAQALLHGPDLLLLDEPTSGLDPMQRDALLTRLREERRRGAAILLSSHVLSEVEAVADRVLLLHAGAVDRVIELQKPGAGDAIEVHFERPPPVALLLNVPGVLAVDAAREGYRVLKLAPHADRDALLHELSGQGWGLIAAAPPRSELLRDFAQLVSRQP